MFKILYGFNQIDCAKQNVEKKVKYSDAEYGENKQMANRISAWNEDGVIAELLRQESGDGSKK